jgi:flagellar motor switch protein FliM
MSRLLTQAEVDALLTSFEPEEETGSGTKEELYDLRAPLVLAGERLALVQAACERLANTIAESLTLLLIAERPVHGHFVGLTQQPAATVLGTLGVGEPLGLLLDEHDEAVGAICLQPELALALVDRLQGGEGYLQDAQPRAISPIEQKLLGEALTRMTKHLDRTTALAPVHGGGLDTDAVFGRLANRGGTLAAIQFRMSTALGDASCRLLLSPVLIHRLVTPKPDPQRPEAPLELREALARVPVQVEPVVTGSRLRFRDLKRVQPGQVIELDVRANEGIGLRFNGELLATGRFERQSSERAFVVEELVGDQPVDSGEARKRTANE